MTVIRNITLDSNNPYELGKFWEAVLGWPMGAEYAPGDGEVLLEGPEGLPGLLIIEVPEPKSAKSRMHFDLQPQTTHDEDWPAFWPSARSSSRTTARPTAPAGCGAGTRRAPPSRRTPDRHGRSKIDDVARSDGGRGV